MRFYIASAIVLILKWKITFLVTNYLLCQSFYVHVHFFEIQKLWIHLFAASRIPLNRSLIIIICNNLIYFHILMKYRKFLQYNNCNRDSEYKLQYNNCNRRLLPERPNDKIVKIDYWFFARFWQRKKQLANEDVIRDITSSILSLLSANVPSALNYLLAANSTCGMHSTEFRHVTSILMNRNHWSNTTGTESVLTLFANNAIRTWRNENSRFYPKDKSFR